MVLRIDIWVKHLIGIVFKDTQVLSHNVLIHLWTAIDILTSYVDSFNPRRFSLASGIRHIKLFHTVPMNAVWNCAWINSHITLIVISSCCLIIIIFTTNWKVVLAVSREMLQLWYLLLLLSSSYLAIDSILHTHYYVLLQVWKEKQLLLLLVTWRHHWDLISLVLTWMHASRCVIDTFS